MKEKSQKDRKTCGVTDGQGASCPPGRLNVKTGPSLAYILIFSILVVSSRLLLFWGFSECFSFSNLVHSSTTSRFTNIS